MDISNGPGLRVSLFTQGCPHHCPGCFNPETWALEGGKDFGKEDEDLIISLCQDEHCAGLSLLGGEPLIERNLAPLEQLIQRFREECPGKTVWLWTGYTIENLSSAQLHIVQLCDTIIDGPFINAKKNLSLFYAGSTNQRLWDVQPNGTLLERPIPTTNGSQSSK